MRYNPLATKAGGYKTPTKEIKIMTLSQEEKGCKGMNKYYDMSNYDAGVIGNTTKEAKRHMDSIDYHGEAISKGGLVHTIVGVDGIEPVCQRWYTVKGVGYKRWVEVSAWYDY